jgi:uncharacterized cupredoxin-like copper-binding protein
MKFHHRALMAAVACAAAGLSTAAWADTRISVKLTGEEHEMMGAELSQSTVPAGPVEFDVVNAAAKTGHEMIVIKLKSRTEKLAVVPGTGRVDEKTLQSLGEVSKLKPGMGGTLKATLTPGDYLVFCNHKGHYEAGMEAALTVTP